MCLMEKKLFHEPLLPKISLHKDSPRLSVSKIAKNSIGPITNLCPRIICGCECHLERLSNIDERRERRFTEAYKDKNTRL